MKTTVEISFEHKADFNFPGYSLVYEQDKHAHSPSRLFQLCMASAPNTRFDSPYHSLRFLHATYSVSGEGHKEFPPLKLDSHTFPVTYRGTKANLQNDDIRISFSICLDDFSDPNVIFPKIGLLNLVWCCVMHSGAGQLICSRDALTQGLHEIYPIAMGVISSGQLGWELVSSNGVMVPAEDALKFWESILNLLGKKYWKVN